MARTGNNVCTIKGRFSALILAFRMQKLNVIEHNVRLCETGLEAESDKPFGIKPSHEF